MRGADTLAWTRRSAVLGAAAVTLAGCLGGNNIALMHTRLLFGSMKKARPLTREDVAKFSAASIAVRLGSGNEVLVLLQQESGRDLYWLSTDRVMLVTRGGRLIQTSGLLNDLLHTSLSGPDPVDGGLLRAAGQMSVRRLDYETFGNGIPATSKYRIVKKDPIHIIGATIPTVRVSERVRMRKLKWYFRNTYWVHEETGLVWKSVQHFHPDHPPLTITAMRPVRERAAP